MEVKIDYFDEGIYHHQDCGIACGVVKVHNKVQGDHGRGPGRSEQGLKEAKGLGSSGFGIRTGFGMRTDFKEGTIGLYVHLHLWPPKTLGQESAGRFVAKVS